MDPNATLAEIRDLLTIRRNSMEDMFDDLCRAGQLFRDLDEWLSTQGFLPDDWNHNYHAKR